MAGIIAITAISATPKRRWREAGSLGSVAVMGKTPKSAAHKAKVGERLKAARLAVEPNAAKFSREMGIDNRTLQKWEDGTNYPDEFFLLKFSNMTGVPVDFIFRGLITGDMPPIIAARIAVAFPHLLDEAAEAAAQAAAERRSYA